MNGLIFFHQLSLDPYEGEQFILQWAAVPHQIVSGEIIHVQPRIPLPLTLFSSMFLHGGFMHLFGNMLYLWIFGNNIEDTLGHFRFFLFYSICGLFAGIAQIYSDPFSTAPMIGASGAIAGVLGAYLILFPGAQVKTLVFFIIILKIIRIPALLVLGFWFFMQIINLGGQTGEGGVAWFAHIGGFVAGMVLVKIFQPRRPMIRRRWA